MKEMMMDWNRVEASWKQLKGNTKEEWGKLSDDDLDVINGRREQLDVKLQERYGYAKDHTRQEVDAWYRRRNGNLRQLLTVVQIQAEHNMASNSDLRDRSLADTDLVQNFEQLRADIGLLPIPWTDT